MPGWCADWKYGGNIADALPAQSFPSAPLRRPDGMANGRLSHQRRRALPDQISAISMDR